VDELHSTIAGLLADGGQRYTRSRRAVIEVLAGAQRPLTLPEILDCDPELAQSSAYRNLAELVEAGVIRRIITSDEHSHFELEEHLTGEHHHHLICGGCGAVTDFVVPVELEQLIDRAADTAGRQQRFKVDHHRFDLLGRCAACG
jgi:Fur family transcriptional regulator, ferric uptake regulator